MGRTTKELSALEISRIRTAGLNFVGGVSGLALHVSITGARSWILRTMVGGKRKDIGLGGFPDVTLAGAREAARAAKEKIKGGIDPVAERRANRAKLVADRENEKTFTQCAAALIESKEAGWSNKKHAKQWSSTLEQYAYPIIGKMPVREVKLEHILRILEPIWTKKTETASRLRARIENVLDYAKVRGYRSGDNPAAWRGNLDAILPAATKVAKVAHHAALPYAQVGSFMERLRKQQGIAARALEFTILTAARSGEVRGVRWPEIDLAGKRWVVPAERMKAGKEHHVPLSDAAVDLLKNLPRHAESDIVFPNTKGTELSDMALTAVLRRMKIDVTAHGFRSTFRDWAGETTAYPREVIEHALAHQLKDKAEAAYARGTLFDKRRRLMEDWAKQCATVKPAGEVVPINIGTAA